MGFSRLYITNNKPANNKSIDLFWKKKEVIFNY